MPSRTRRAGLEAEGLGIVFLEAAAAGLPVLVGNSGGAPDAVLDGETRRRDESWTDGDRTSWRTGSRSCRPIQKPLG
nr:glycosyltransferase [Kitasatospora xanthocidica]